MTKISKRIFSKYCPARVDSHDTKAKKNTGNQLLFGSQFLLLSNQLYTQGNLESIRVFFGPLKKAGLTGQFFSAKVGLTGQFDFKNCPTDLISVNSGK